MYQSYCKQRNKAAKLLRNTKREFELKIAKEAKVNPKAFYKYCNSRSGSKQHVIRLKGQDGKTILSKKENAELLNQYFCSVFTNEDDAPELILNNAYENTFEEEVGKPFDFPIDNQDNELENVSIDIAEVLKHLKDLDPHKSTVPFCIHPLILKEAAEELVRPIYNIFKVSLEQGKLPTCWKTGIVSPIHKSGDRHAPSNYRPITITSILSRILEKIVKATFTEHIATNNLLNSNQHGFISGRSCLTNLLHTMEELMWNIDNGLVMDEIFLDFSKAFDKVPHQRLLFKLKQYGICGRLLNWIESFLSHRKQAVKVNNVMSGTRNVSSGVPQGSVLGPLLFLMFINDMPLNIKSGIKLFADDTKLYRIIRSVNDADILQEDLDKLTHWCKEWKMVFNTSKCHVLHISRNKKNCPTNQLYYYHIDGQLLVPSVTEKDLGVSISNDLKPHQHIVNIVKKANKTLGMIKRSFTHINRDIFMLTYKTFIRPSLEYCQSVWSPHLQKDINMLENVQRRASKMVLGLHNIPYEQRMQKLSLQSLQYRRTRGDMILMFKIFNHLIDIDPQDFFTLKRYQNNRGHNWKVEFKRQPNTDYGRNTFTYRVIIPWNKLPASVVNSKDVPEFKRNYDNHFGPAQFTT